MAKLRKGWRSTLSDNIKKTETCPAFSDLPVKQVEPWYEKVKKLKKKKLKKILKNIKRREQFQGNWSNPKSTSN